jgi:hypothetical protein
MVSRCDLLYIHFLGLEDFYAQARVVLTRKYREICMAGHLDLEKFAIKRSLATFARGLHPRI